MRLSIIIPVYNERSVIHLLYERLIGVVKTLDVEYELVFINDGSKDNSLFLLTELSAKDSGVKVLSFSRNFGHQNAVIAGIENCTGDCAVVIDADLQDPPELIVDMLAKWKEGYQVVYAQRSKRKGESLFKKLTALVFYRILYKLSEIEIPTDTGDFRLIDRKVIEALRSMPEKNKYIRGMVSWTGFRQYALMYERDERAAGETKYPLSKMLKFALTGITSFSNKPLIAAIYLGFFVTFIALLVVLWTLYLHYFTNDTIAGWTSLILVILFMGGVQLISVGVLGIYIGNIISEVRGRPTYIIDQKINF